MDIKYVVEDGSEKVFDEKGNVILAMRKVSWGANASEENVKLELRKWYMDADGGERPNKGFSFLTEDGPNNLASCLVESGYGNTREVLTHLSTREDFRPELNVVLGKKDEHYDDSVTDEMYGAEDILGI